jgi:hypothetical protein
MIRYRVGDRVRVVERWGDGPTDWSFAVLGRSEMDFVKIPGGMLRADEIERVLLTMKDRVTDTFSLHLSEDKAAGMPRTKAILYVRPKRPLNMKQLAQDVANALRVGPSLTFTDGVKRGLYCPLECKELPQETSTRKHRRIVQDLS